MARLSAAYSRFGNRFVKVLTEGSTDPMGPRHPPSPESFFDRSVGISVTVPPNRPEPLFCMRAYVGNTDVQWYRFLRERRDLDEVNFWFPNPGQLLTGGNADSLTPFLFKLKAEQQHAICGFGFLVDAMKMPAWFAWETFGVKNGAPSERDMFERIGRYRKPPPGVPFRQLEIGCLIVVQPTFFPDDLLVPAPDDWKQNIVRGAYYDTAEGVGARLWRDCQERAAHLSAVQAVEVHNAPALHPELHKWGAPQVVRPRLGQGAFRVAVTKAYGGACAVTREHSLPVIDAAHIRPYADDGEHTVSNGIALRADIHRLFDRGYVSFDEDSRFVVSRRLREDYDNGNQYYAIQDAKTPLWVPKRAGARPDPAALAWHREQVFLG